MCIDMCLGMCSDEIDELSLIVAGCAVFIFVLSDGCLESPFTKRELAAAVDAEVPVLLILKEGSRWPDSYGQLNDTFPSNMLIDAAFDGAKAPCREVFKNKAIQHSNEYFGAFSANMLKQLQAAVDAGSKTYPQGAAVQALTQRRRLLASRAATKVSDQDGCSSDKEPPHFGTGEPSLPSSHQVPSPTTLQASTTGYWLPHQVIELQTSILDTMTCHSHKHAQLQGEQLLLGVGEQNRHLVEALAAQSELHAKQMATQAELHARQLAGQAEAHAKQMSEALRMQAENFKDLISVLSPGRGA